jgi:WD40 repeat protein
MAVPIVDGYFVNSLAYQAGSGRVYLSRAGSIQYYFPSAPTLYNTGWTGGPISISPDGTRILYVRQSGNYDVFSRVIATGIETRLTNDVAIEESPTWVGNGAVAYYKDGAIRVHRLSPPNAGSVFSVSADGFSRLAGSPDGRYIVAHGVAEGQPTLRMFIVSMSGFVATGTATATLSYSVNDLTFSPDNQRIAVADLNGRIHEFDLNLAHLGILREGEASAPVRLAWQPFVTDATIVGSGGFFGTNSAGLIVGQVGDVRAGMVLFDAATRATAAVALEPSEPGAKNVTVRVTADQLTKLAYTPDRALRFAHLVSTSPVVDGAFVVFNAETGMVSSIIPFNIAAKNPPRVRSEGDRVAVEGDVIGIWDSSGKRHNAAGARTLVDSKTGTPLGR